MQNKNKRKFLKMQSISIELFIYLVDRLQIINIYKMKLIIIVKYELLYTFHI